MGTKKTQLIVLVGALILFVLLFISIATQVGMELTSFIAILGAAGLAVGLALPFQLDPQ